MQKCEYAYIAADSEYVIDISCQICTVGVPDIYSKQCECSRKISCLGFAAVPATRNRKNHLGQTRSPVENGAQIFNFVMTLNVKISASTNFETATIATNAKLLVPAKVAHCSINMAIINLM